MGLCSCFGCFGADNRRSKEEERVASEEARAKAAEAAQKRFYLFPFLNFPLSLTRQEQFENSAAGRAARAHQQAIAKQSANTNKGEPVLKWQMG
ncbi:hypothetical protein ACSQ67_000256 [Phaseolus vulgaris]